MQPVQNGQHVQVGTILRIVGVLALLGAAAVHFSLLGAGGDVPDSHVAYFAAAAWVQLGLALWLMRTSRVAAAAVVVVELGLIGVWAVSRTVDVLLGSSGSLESWRLVGVTIGLQGLALFAAAGLLSPVLATQRIQSEVGFAGVGAVAAVVALLSGLLFSPAWRPDAPKAAAAPAAAHSDSHGQEAAAAPKSSAIHSHDAAGDDHADHDARKQAELDFLFPDGDTKGWEDVENGVDHPHVDEVPENEIPAATRAELRRQLALTMQPIAAFPTVASAEAAGYRRAGPFTPGLGAHYVGAGAYIGAEPMTDDQITHPSTLVYAGTDPDSPLVGFMFVSLSAKNPEGFAGPNDYWHTHKGVCIRPSSDGSIDALGADGSITESDCKAQRGNWMAITQSLLHVWTVPGYSDPLGVFAHTNPAVICPDGTYHTRGMGKLTNCLEP